jgi:hypothetical protein
MITIWGKLGSMALITVSTIEKHNPFESNLMVLFVSAIFAAASEVVLFIMHMLLVGAWTENTATSASNFPDSPATNFTENVTIASTPGQYHHGMGVFLSAMQLFSFGCVVLSVPMVLLQLCSLSRKVVTTVGFRRSMSVSQVQPVEQELLYPEFLIVCLCPILASSHCQTLSKVKPALYLWSFFSCFVHHPPQYF